MHTHAICGIGCAVALSQAPTHRLKLGNPRIVRQASWVTTNTNCADKGCPKKMNV